MIDLGKLSTSLIDGKLDGPSGHLICILGAEQVTYGYKFCLIY